MIRPLAIVLIILSFGTLSACISKQLVLGIELRMYSEQGHGIYLLDPPLFSRNLDPGLPPELKGKVIRMGPIIKGSESMKRYGFIKKEKNLIPDDIMFKFQYQTMSDCGPDDGLKSKGYQYNKNIGYDIDIKIGPDYIRNSRCKTFTPTGEVYTRTLNLAEMLKDDKYIKRHNKKMENNWSEMYYSTVIFEFYDKGVIKVKTRGGNTNRFR